MPQYHNPYHRELWHNKLQVVTVVFNSPRYDSRYALYEEFRKHIENTGDVSHHACKKDTPKTPLWTAEIAFGDRSFCVTQEDDPFDVRLRTSTELWHKEKAINLTVARFPYDWEYMAWIDADIAFLRHDWAEETIHKLQHTPIVQMWGDALDLDPKGNMFQRHVSFAKSYIDGVPRNPDGGCSHPYYGVNGDKLKQFYWHPGFAWAMRRDAWEQLGGLLDTPILGAADNHMAHGLIGEAEQSFHKDVTPQYKRSVMRWQERSLRYIRKNIGYVDGTIVHKWHGRKRDRRYWDRWKILVNHQFNPEEDIKLDYQGLYQFEMYNNSSDPNFTRMEKLRDDVRNYFYSRNEDSIDMDVTEVRI